MRYISTRGNAPILSFGQANMRGLADDRGLYLPEKIPLWRPEMLERNASYKTIVNSIMRLYATDIEAADMRRLVSQAYGSQWSHPDIAPVVTLDDGMHVLELFHGPTLAFKDLAMQLVSRIVKYLKRGGARIALVVATSGDTGSAAIEAFRGMRGIDVFVLFPDGAVSPFQRAQMTTATERNIHPIAVRGNFDACQKIVKELLSEPFKSEYNTCGVNSIAWGRILTQIPYYYKAYLKVARFIGERVTFVVPTGNMGDIYAGWCARQMGLPIDLVLATNANHVLYDVFKTGEYHPWKKTRPTFSPSMDIQQASNWERLLYDVVLRDPRAVVRHMRSLEKKGGFELTRSQFERLQHIGIKAGWASEKHAQDAMQRIHQKYDYVADPHTSVGLSVGMHMKLKGPVVYLATASPVKFDEAVKIAGITPPKRPAQFIGIEARPEPQTVTLDADKEAVKTYIRSVLAK